MALQIISHTLWLCVLVNAKETHDWPLQNSTFQSILLWWRLAAASLQGWEVVMITKPWVLQPYTLVPCKPRWISKLQTDMVGYLNLNWLTLNQTVTHQGFLVLRKKELPQMLYISEKINWKWIIQNFRRKETVELRSGKVYISPENRKYCSFISCQVSTKITV